MLCGHPDRNRTRCLGGRVSKNPQSCRSHYRWAKGNHGCRHLLGELVSHSPSLTLELMLTISACHCSVHLSTPKAYLSTLPPLPTHESPGYPPYATSLWKAVAMSSAVINSSLKKLSLCISRTGRRKGRIL